MLKGCPFNIALTQHNVFVAFAQCICCICTMYSLHLYNVFVVFVQCIRRICTMCLLYCKSICWSWESWVSGSCERGEDVPLAQLSSTTMDGASFGKAKWFYSKVDQKLPRRRMNIYFDNRIRTFPIWSNNLNSHLNPELFQDKTMSNSPIVHWNYVNCLFFWNISINWWDLSQSWTLRNPNEYKILRTPEYLS